MIKIGILSAVLSCSAHAGTANLYIEKASKEFTEQCLKDKVDVATNCDLVGHVITYPGIDAFCIMIGPRLGRCIVPRIGKGQENEEGATIYPADIHDIDFDREEI